MTSPILVTGGTGTLGRHVVRRLQADGREIRVLTRRERKAEEGVRFVTGDLRTGNGVPEAVDGVETIVHCAGTNKGDDATTRTLVRALPAAARPHLVYISVVGADRVPMHGAVDRTMFGYFGSKHAAEQVVSGCGLPWTTLRATQFYDLVLTVARALAKLPVVPVPAASPCQPVDSDEVAARLVELALGRPQGMVAEMAGPRTYTFAELMHGYLDAVGRRRPVVRMPVPGRAARAVRDGAILAPEHTDGTRTWEDFLAEQVAQPVPEGARSGRR